MYLWGLRLCQRLEAPHFDSFFMIIQFFKAWAQVRILSYAFLHGIYMRRPDSKYFIICIACGTWITWT